MSSSSAVDPTATTVNFQPPTLQRFKTGDLTKYASKSSRQSDSDSDHKSTSSSLPSRPARRSSFLNRGAGATRPWSAESVGRHAISMLLNDPDQTRQTSSKPRLFSALTSTSKPRLDLIPVTNVKIRSVVASDFDVYLNSIQLALPGWNANKNYAKKVDRAVARWAERADATGIDATLLTPLEDVEGGGGGGAGGSLEHVPRLFFDPSFNLSKAECFNELRERLLGKQKLMIVSEDDFAVLQDGLSKHLESIEEQLLREISEASPVFTLAQTNLRSLTIEVANSLTQLDELRNRTMAQKRRMDDALRAIKLFRRMNNLTRVIETVKLLQEAANTEKNVYENHSVGKEREFLEIIAAARLKLIDVGDLRLLWCFQRMEERLAALVKLAAEEVERDFLETLINFMQNEALSSSSSSSSTVPFRASSLLRILVERGMVETVLHTFSMEAEKKCFYIYRNVGLYILKSVVIMLVRFLLL